MLVAVAVLAFSVVSVSLPALAAKPRPAEDPTTTTTVPGDVRFVQWEDASAIGNASPGQYPGSMHWITNHTTGARAFWLRGFDGSGIDVAIIDSGVVPVDGLRSPGKVVNGADLSFESQADNLRYLDTYGHGTHLAGIVAGRDGADSSFRGIAPGARIVNVKVADSQGAVDVSQVIAAIHWVVDHRHDNDLDVRVLLLAYGTDGAQSYESDPLAAAVERAWNAGIVVVVAAGNDGNGALLRNPANDPFVIAVGAAENDANAVTGVAGFSNCGNGQRFVDVVAPGRSILSLRAPGSYADQHFPEAAVDGTLFLGSGTSQAAAIVAGGAALLLDQRPELNADQVKHILTRDTADYLPGVDPFCQGAGTLDLGEAVGAATPTVQRSSQTHHPSFGDGSLEAARGSNHVFDEGVALTGEIDIMSSPWPGSGCAEVTEGEGRDRRTYVLCPSLWDGGEFNGALWSGASWSGASWSGASWSGASWSGASWSGASWSGDTWAGLSWN